METKRRKSFHLISRFLIIAASMIGFTFQVYQISQQYFSFTTRTQITIRPPNTVGKHHVALCCSLFDILDYKRLESDTGITRSSLFNTSEVTSKIDTRYNGSSIIIEAMERYLTVHQMLNYTPAVDQVFDSCMYRDRKDILSMLRKKECEKRLEVTKFLFLDSMCYQFGPRKPKEFSPFQIALSMASQFSIFEVRLGPAFKSIDRTIFITFLPGERMWSRYFAAVTYMKTGKGVKQADHLDIVPSDTKVRKLPPPFDTNCDGSQETVYICIEDCLSRGFKTFYRMPAGLMIEKEIDYRILFCREDNELIWKEARSKCIKTCLENPCNQDYTKTYAYTRFFDVENPVGFTLFSPLEPETLLESVPVQTFVEFFSFVCGCFGTWFGISFFSLLSFTRNRPNSAPVINNFKDSVIVNCTCTCNKVTRRQRLNRI